MSHVIYNITKKDLLDKIRYMEINRINLIGDRDWFTKYNKDNLRDGISARYMNGALLDCKYYKNGLLHGEDFGKDFEVGYYYYSVWKEDVKVYHVYHTMGDHDDICCIIL